MENRKRGRQTNNYHSFIRDEEDSNYLSSLTELERERILSERYDEMNRVKERTNVLKNLGRIDDSELQAGRLSSSEFPEILRHNSINNRLPVDKLQYNNVSVQRTTETGDPMTKIIQDVTNVDCIEEKEKEKSVDSDGSSNSNTSTGIVHTSPLYNLPIISADDLRQIQLTQSGCVKILELPPSIRNKALRGIFCKVETLTLENNKSNNNNNIICFVRGTLPSESKDVRVSTITTSGTIMRQIRVNVNLLVLTLDGRNRVIPITSLSNSFASKEDLEELNEYLKKSSVSVEFHNKYKIDQTYDTLLNKSKQIKKNKSFKYHVHRVLDEDCCDSDTDILMLESQHRGYIKGNEPFIQLSSPSPSSSPHMKFSLLIVAVLLENRSKALILHKARNFRWTSDVIDKKLIFQKSMNQSILSDGDQKCIEESNRSSASLGDDLPFITLGKSNAKTRVPRTRSICTNNTINRIENKDINSSFSSINLMEDLMEDTSLVNSKETQSIFNQKEKDKENLKIKIKGKSRGLISELIFNSSHKRNVNISKQTKHEEEEEIPSYNERLQCLLSNKNPIISNIEGIEYNINNRSFCDEIIDEMEEKGDERFIGLPLIDVMSFMNIMEQRIEDFNVLDAWGRGLKTTSAEIMDFDEWCKRVEA